MNAHLWRIVALVAIAAAIAFVAYQPTLPDRDDFGIQVQGPIGRASARVLSVHRGSPASLAGIRSGDLVTYPMSPFDFARTVFATAGEHVTVRVNGIRNVTLVARNRPAVGIPWWITGARLAFLIVAALLVFRRPADPAVRALVVFLFAYGIAIALNSGRLPWPLASFAVLQIGQPILFIVGTMSLGIFGAIFPSGRAGPAAGMLARGALAVGALLIAAAIGFNLVPLDRPIVRFALPFTLACFVVLALVVIAVFVVAYNQGAAEERERRRWISLLLCIVVGALFVDAIINTAFGFSSVVDQATIVPVMALPFGLAYVILRHRVIDVGFVLNKATVYTIVSVIVVGLFVILETLVSRYVEQNNRITSVTVVIGVSLIIGFSVRYIHDRVDRFVDSVLFRERHAAEAAIRAFAHDASYITDRSILLERAVRTLERYAHAKGAAVWLTGTPGQYRPASSSFERTFPLSENDPAIVAMRARGVAVDLQENDSALPGALAAPMIVRGELLGMVICGPKPDGESYAPDERDALGLLATSVGHALDTIEVRELRRRLEELSGPTRGPVPATSGNVPEF